MGSINSPLSQTSSVDPDQSTLVFDSPHLDAPEIDSIFSPAPPFGKILKRIPKGARDAAAGEFQSSLNAVLEHPDDRQAWRKLITFAGGCLSQPTDRGGKRQNLTTAVLAQIKLYGTSSILPESEPMKCDRLRKKPLQTDDASAARRAATGMDEGDVQGAIRQLCSLDKLTIPSAESYLELLSKHPQAPTDRRPQYPVVTTPLRVSTDQVLVAIKSFPPGSSRGSDGLRS